MSSAARLLLRLLSLAVQRLPLVLVLRAGGLLGHIGYYAFPNRRQGTFENLALAFPDKSAKEIRRIIRAMAANLGRNMMEFLRLPTMTPADFNRFVAFEGLEHLDEALARKKGAFILTAHFGNWDLIAASVASLGYRTNVVTKHLKNELLNSLWFDYRSRLRVNSVYRERSLRHIVEHLRSNEIVGFVLDQNVRRDEGVFVRFFGRPACTLRSLAAMSDRLDVPVVPGFIVRMSGGHHRVVFEPAIPFTRKETMHESIVFNTQVYTSVIERYVRQYPDHWIWLHRRWKTQPEV